jgi:hypothetical protein
VLLPVLGILFTFTLVVSLYFYWPLLGVGKDSFWSLKTVSPAFGVRRWPKENQDERLRNAFDDCWKREKMTIKDKWQYIQQEDNPNPRYIPATLRPPLS